MRTSRLTGLVVTIVCVAGACSSAAGELAADGVAAVSGEAMTTTTHPPSRGPVTIETAADSSGRSVVGTFEVTAGAELLGCQAGTFIDTPYPRGIVKAFSCDTGSRVGGFDVLFQPRDNRVPGQVSGPWWVDATTGGFEWLGGGGDFVVVYDPDFPTGVETLTGEIMFSPDGTDFVGGAGS